MNDDQPDLVTLLNHQRPAPIELWLDPLSLATSLLLPYLHLDGHTNGGRPWRFRGRDEVALRLLPDPQDEMSGVAAQCILAVRAWAVQRTAGDQLIPMDYDLPWAYLGDIQRDMGSVRSIGLPHLVALAGREGEWLGDWVAEHRDSRAVQAALAGETADAEQLGIREAPTIMLGDLSYEPADMPDDITDRISRYLDERA